MSLRARFQAGDLHPHPSRPQMGWAGRGEERQGPGRRAGRDGLAPLGHRDTTATAAAVLLARSCIPSRAEMSGGAQVPLQVDGQPPGPTQTQRRASRRTRLPGTFQTGGRFRDAARKAGAANGASDLGVQRPARLTARTRPLPLPRTLRWRRVREGHVNQWFVTRRWGWAGRAARGLEDLVATGTRGRAPFRLLLLCAGAWVEAPGLVARGPCCFPTSCSRVRARGRRGGRGVPGARASGSERFARPGGCAALGRAGARGGIRDRAGASLRWAEAAR